MTLVSVKLKNALERRAGNQAAEHGGGERQHRADERRLDDLARADPYMYKPTNSAIGIVQAIVNVPHELPGTSRTDDAAGKPSALMLSVDRELRAAACRCNTLR